MADKITDLANELQAEVQKTNEFDALKEAYGKLKADKEAFELFENFQQAQVSLQQKQMTGEQPTEDEINSAQSMAQQMGSNEIIGDLMTKERDLNQVLSNVNQIVTQPIVELYRN
ncbi:YlbF family regulator [Lentilactobacillus sp. Marseille-Q4993]|uniref:YlbF family regulator n=1 Tax=Lentilactobacillus sp. Marseille-Q4993 TaxID=3039492 RepID=UPI0024BCDE0A|nr:YlbF family regulator [Lentilactobacillus sp. Marseille-Q4993]